MKNLFKSKVAIIIAAAVLVALVATIVILVLLLGGGSDSYRTVKIYQIDGKAEVYRGGGEPIAPYVNMLLESGDELKTLEDGYVYIKLDEDKYLMASPNSSFSLEAKGKEADGKTHIELKSGDIAVHVIDPLGEGAEFKVSTGNSTMAIRGTSFSVSYDSSADETVTVYEVYEGGVTVSAEGKDYSADAGETVSVITDDDGTTVVEGETSYDDMDVPELEFVKLAIEQGKDMGITAEQIDDIIESKRNGMISVTFKYGDRVFAVIPVKKGSRVINPTLKPAANGGWDFDFTQPVYEDTVIDWKH